MTNKEHLRKNKRETEIGTYKKNIRERQIHRKRKRERDKKERERYIESVRET